MFKLLFLFCVFTLLLTAPLYPSWTVTQSITLYNFSKHIFLLMFYRQKVIKEKAVPKIEGYMFEEHDLVRASATECMCNLVLSTEVSDDVYT